MSPAQIHQDLVEALRESAVSHDMIKMWCRVFQRGGQSCENEHAIGAHTNVTNQ